MPGHTSWLLILSIGMCLVGCDGCAPVAVGGLDQPCSDAGLCEVGLVCNQGVCQDLCDPDPCDDGEICELGQCLPGERGDGGEDAGATDRAAADPGSVEDVTRSDAGPTADRGPGQDRWSPADRVSADTASTDHAAPDTGTDAGTAHCSVPTWSWVKRAGSTVPNGATMTVGDHDRMSDGSVAVTGAFGGNIRFGDGLDAPVLASVADWDAYVARYRPDGSVAWARQAGGEFADRGHGVAVASDNSVLVTGEFTDSIAFGSYGEPTVLAGRGDEDIFLARYLQNGSLVYAVGAGGTGIDMGLGISALPGGEAIATGPFDTGARFGTAAQDPVILESWNNPGGFLARHTADGTLSWARAVSSRGASHGQSIEALPDGSCLVAGMCFTSPSWFGEADQQILSCQHDLFLARFDPSGSLDWVRKDGSLGSTTMFAMASLPDGSSAITGEFTGTALFGEGETRETLLEGRGLWDVFIARYEADGSLRWVRGAGGSGGDHGFDVALTADGLLLVTGKFAGSIDFDEAHRLQGVGYSNVFVAIYSPDGDVMWAINANGTHTAEGHAITADNNGWAMVSGVFNQTVDFGDGAFQLSAQGGQDLFVGRLCIPDVM